MLQSSTVHPKDPRKAKILTFFSPQMELDPTIPGIGGQCRIHLATGASDWSLLTK